MRRVHQILLLMDGLAMVPPIHSMQAQDCPLSTLGPCLTILGATLTGWSGLGTTPKQTYTWKHHHRHTPIYIRMSSP